MRRLVVEPPMEECEAARWATAAELAAAGRMPPRRRREYLAWRAMVRREVGVDARIAYDAAGAPLVENYPVYISVAHCRDRVAVLISDARCAVDIEPVDRSVTGVTERFLTAAERALSDDPLFPLIAWCGKETLYKYAGRKRLDLLRDLSIERADPTGGKLTGRIRNGEPVELTVRFDAGYAVVLIL